MSNELAFYGYAALLAALFVLRRILRRTHKRFFLQPSLVVPEGDHRKRAFTDPVEVAPYILIINSMQFFLGLGMLYVGLVSRVWRVALVVSLVFYVLVAYVLQRILHIQVFTFGHFSFVDPQPNRRSLLLAKQFILRTSGWGDILLSFLIYLPTWTILYRAEVGALTYVAVATLPFLTVSVLRHTSALALQVPRPPWISLGTAVVVTPVLFAWLLGSAAWWLKSTGKPLVDSSMNAATSGRATPGCDSRASSWEVNGRRMRVAVALSGGGYRAALAHAGLLAALQERCVPIDYLTTVSGGSIIGATFALGVSPSAFAQRLRDSRPGLSNDILSFSGILREWINPFSSNAETYSDHLRRVFFGTRTLGSLLERPVLLVNATDLEANGYDAREIFFKARAPGIRTEDGKTLDQNTQIADVVAASAAFPGAFQPKRIAWITNDNPATIKERKFIDGGVVENLGVDGLHRYLSLADPPPERPDILIISDASQYTEGIEFKRKVELVRLLVRSQNLSYEALHRQLYSRYTGRDDFWNWSRTVPRQLQFSRVPYSAIDRRFQSGQPDYLLTVIIPMTSPRPSPGLAALTNCEIRPGRSIAAVQWEVSAYDTLRELDKIEVENTYWLGYNLGQLYSGAVECARASSTDPAHVCASAAPTTTTCKPLVTILPLL